LVTNEDHPKEAPDEDEEDDDTDEDKGLEATVTGPIEVHSIHEIF
jgi:hypothetical protein